MTDKKLQTISLKGIEIRTKESIQVNFFKNQINTKQTMTLIKKQNVGLHLNVQYFTVHSVAS
jgi:hypothetical protein